MSPDDVATVDKTWAELAVHRDALVATLAVSLTTDGSTTQQAQLRARWLVDTIGELVGLLSTPSRLGARAEQLVATWPGSAAAPMFPVDGQVWLRAAREVGPVWTVEAERAWHRAWLLLADVLAEDLVSPFEDAFADRPGVATVTPSRLRAYLAT